MAKIICTQAEYDKLKTVIEDNPQFLADVRVIYDIVKEASDQCNTRVINVKEIVDDMLDYFGLNAQGDTIHGPKGWKCYEVADVSLSQAKSIKRWVDRLMNPHDQYCEMEYDKSTQCASYDIVS